MVLIALILITIKNGLTVQSSKKNTIVGILLSLGNTNFPLSYNVTRFEHCECGIFIGIFLNVNLIKDNTCCYFLKGSIAHNPLELTTLNCLACILCQKDLYSISIATRSHRDLILAESELRHLSAGE